MDDPPPPEGEGEGLVGSGGIDMEEAASVVREAGGGEASEVSWPDALFSSLEMTT